MRLSTAGLLALAVLAVGCPKKTEPADEPPKTMTNKSDPSDAASRDASSPCRDALAIARDGQLDRWRGLPDGCTVADVDATFTRRTPAKAPGDIGPTGAVSYQPAGGAGDGITVQFRGDTPDFLLLLRPRYDQPLPDLLGEPEARLPSQLEGASEQLVWASRGLSAYVTGDAIARLYLFRPTTVEQYKNGSIARVQIHRRRIKR